MGRSVAPHRLARQDQMLAFLREHEGPVSTEEVVKATFVYPCTRNPCPRESWDPGHVHVDYIAGRQALNRLNRFGLVRKTVVPHDRRVFWSADPIEVRT